MHLGNPAAGPAGRADHDPTGLRAPSGPSVTGARLLLGLLVIVAASFGLGRLDVRTSEGLPLGAHDFVAYWSAYDVAAAGGDPYDADEMRVAQSELHPRYVNGAQRFWNPPWSLLVLLPVLVLPFAEAAAAWFVLQAVGALALILVSWRLFRPGERIPSPVFFVLAAAFVPLRESLRLGQMGVAVAFIVLGGLFALRRRHDHLAGALFALTIVKPQTVLVLLLVVGIHVLATRRWRVVGSALVTAATLVLASRLLLPSVWEHWSPLGGAPTHWRTATLASWLRSTFPSSGDGFLVLVPAVALLVTLPWAIANRRELRWDRIPLLLVVSVLTAPYAWIADAMLAIPAHVLAVAALVERRHRWGMVAGILTIATQAGALVAHANGAAYDQFIVIPLVLVVASLLTPAPAPPRQGPAAGDEEPVEAQPGLAADLSIIVPAYQEERRIVPFLDTLVDHMAASDLRIEVIAVDDGSIDGTTAVIESYRDRIPGLRCITLPENRGKGFAVRTGMLAAGGRRRAFIDADGSIHPREIDRLLAVDAAVVIASVAVPGAELDPPQGRLRAGAGALGNRLIQMLVLPGILDSQRGCKVFRGDVADAVFRSCTVDRWAFDVEALALARKFGHEPVEVGIRWSHRDGGTVRPSTYLETLRAVFAISRHLGRQAEVKPLPLPSRRVGPGPRRVAVRGRPATSPDPTCSAPSTPANSSRGADRPALAGRTDGTTGSNR